ncbi:hypothetical protein FJ250_01770, partial [bacterium]|nr:hypothetical protein [bacterium]
MSFVNLAFVNLAFANLAFANLAFAAGAAAGSDRVNPLLADLDTPEGTPPFARIELADIEPA